MKSEAIDQAVNMAYQSKQALIRFGNELSDVFKGLELQVNMDIEDFGNFVNVLFDNNTTGHISNTEHGFTLLQTADNG